jgi:hypothetical protein
MQVGGGGYRSKEVNVGFNREGVRGSILVLGTVQPTSYINIRKNGRIYSKKVQPDLLAALKALRHPQEDRYLWIDAICINQADIGERNHQVEMMSTIYGQAKRV